jgi:PAS domain S-box-containing protein
MKTDRISSAGAVFAAFFAAFLAASSALAAPAAPKAVLTIYSQAREASNISAFDEGVRKALQTSSGDDIAYYAEFIDSSRFSGEPHIKAVRDYLFSKYQGRRLDALVLVGRTAASVVEGQPLFASLPTVAYTLDDAELRVPDSAYRLVGSFGPDQRQTLALALALHPDTRHVFVVVQTSPEGPRFDVDIRRELAPFESQVTIRYLSEMAMADIIGTLQHAPAQSLVVYVRQTTNLSGVRSDPRDLLTLLQRSISLPIYGGFDTYLGYGVVGGYLYSSEASGAAAGALAWRLANGERPSAERAGGNSAAPVFDARQLRRWNIRDSQLPAGSVILFREPTFWARYRRYAIAAVAVFAMQLGFIGWLLVELRRRQRAERARTESEARTGAILRAIPDVMFLMDRNGTYLDYHARDPKELYVPPEQFLGKTMADVMPEELASMFGDAIARAGAEPSVVEYRLPAPTGDRFFEARLVSCGPDRVLTMVRDITAQKLVEMQFQVSQDRYALATAAAGVGVWDWNAETGELYVDLEVMRILGYAEDEKVDYRVDWNRLVHPHDLERMRACVFDCVEGRRENYDIEHRMLHKDGSLRWFHTRGSSVRHPDGKPYRVLGTFTDVTDRKRAEETLLTRETTLRESYAEIQMLGGRLIAAQETEHKRLARELHDDLSQKLALLAIDAEQLAQDAPDFAERADRIARRAGEIASNVHEVSHRLHPFKLDVLGLVAAVQSVCNDVSAQHGLVVEFHHQQVSEALSSEVVLCVYRIVQEALRNIVKHSHAQRASVHLEQQGPHLTLNIADSGVGFTPGTLEHSGLGLVSIRERVNLLGGQMVIRSAPGRGTRLGVRVPVDSKVAQAREAAFGPQIAESA